MADAPEESIWKRTWAATERMLALGWLGVLHHLAELGLDWRLHSYPRLLKFLDAVTVTAFSLIYVVLILELVAVFVPRLRLPLTGLLNIGKAASTSAEATDEES